MMNVKEQIISITGSVNLKAEKLEVEEYTSYDLALDNRDALASDAYKNAENYYKSVFENAGGSINFYPDKSGAAPTAVLPEKSQ